MSSETLQAQQIFFSQEQVLEELRKRDLSVEEVQTALAVKGIDLANLNASQITAEEIKIIEETILELESQKKANPPIEKDLDNAQPVIIDSVGVDTMEVERDIRKGDSLPEPIIYGQQLFRDRIIQAFDKSDQILAPESYILGPGDELVISVWGRSQFESSYTIEKDGFIRLSDNRQRIYLKGLDLAEARKKIRSILKNFLSFDNGEFDLSLNYSRTVSISIFGEVLDNPGSYSIPAFNTAFNALALVNGTNNIGSLRSIKLNKNNGETLILDVYEVLKNPSVQSKFFLDDNDVIIVPVAEKVVSIDGAVRRPFKYELKGNEGIKELIEYAGGFREDAFKRKIQLKRYEDTEQKIYDIDWNAYVNSANNYILEDGDVIYVETIESEVKNVVEIKGAVLKPGTFERTRDMQLVDLIDKAILADKADLETAYISRTSIDGSTSIIKVDLQTALRDNTSAQNVVLQNGDIVEVWALDRFSDKKNFAVDGAVRLPGNFPYDNTRTIRVKDAILLAGGMTRDASNFAIIHSNDPLNPKIKTYKTIQNLDKIFENESNENNYLVQAFDSLVIPSKNEFIEESYVRVEGAVNQPGEYQYGQGMTLKDLLIIAGGFKMAAATNNIEISRVIIQNNQPTKTVIARLEMTRDFEMEATEDAEYVLQPFDNVAVRFINEFELQQRVFLEGEVKFPGPYAIAEHNEKISSIINRAGGLTDEAFPAGATLERSDNDYGSVVIKLEEIMNDPNSEFNFVIKNNDRIFVPKIKEFVTIRGATRAKEVVGEDAINEGNEIHVPFHKGKDALFYINEYAGGLSDFADKQKIFVEHANGEIKRPKSGFLSRKYPKVLQGSTISVGYKVVDKEEQKQQEDVNWTKVLGDSVAQAMSILTLILVIQRLD